ncbi:MAG: MFS transporter, partial [Gammaproteobacteria bacterium]|nr:MFS transporter [Gammaproteobacteria bacterium]
MRNLGGSVGIALISTIITEYTQTGWNQIGGHITPYDPAIQTFLHATGLVSAPRTWAILGAVLGQQAAMRGILDALVFVFWSFLGMIPIVLFMPAAKQSPSTPPEPILAE